MCPYMNQQFSPGRQGFVFLLLYLLVPLTGLSQPNDTLFDFPRLSESAYAPGMVYIKWLSVGQKPAPQFIVMRYDHDKPVEVTGEKMRYQQNDTTYYVLQDTMAPIILAPQVLQYFMAPHDTTGVAGRSSDIVLITAESQGVAWFIENMALRLPDANGIRLQWRYSEPQNTLLYRIYRSEELDKGYELLANLAATETTYTDISTEPDKLYHYQIHAVPVTGNAPVLSNVVFSASYNPQPPVPPHIESGFPLEGGAVLYVQVTDSEAHGLRIYRDDGHTPELSLVSDLLPLNDSLYVIFYDTISNLSGRKTYTYAAKTESTSFVESALSNKVYIRPRIGEPPGAPLTLQAYEEDRQVLLFWENMQARDIGIAGYQVTRSEVSADGLASEPVPIHEDAFLRDNRYTDNELLPARVYTYRVYAIDIDGNRSHEAAMVTIGTEEDLPVAPFALQAMPVDEGVYLTWATVIYPGMQNISLYRYEREQAAILITDLPADAEDYLDESAENDKVYFYYLTTTNQAGLESHASEEVGVAR